MGFFPGDKVMQTRNDYEKGIYNGDVGTVWTATPQKVFVRYFDKEVVYEGEERFDLRLAYAVTVHKSQGSEYSVVILPWMPMFYKMLRRNILYTAITRAKVKLILVGSKQAVYRAVHNTESDKRNTRLGEMILKERYALESREKIVPLPDADRTKYEQIAMNF